MVLLLLLLVAKDEVVTVWRHSVIRNMTLVLSFVENMLFFFVVVVVAAAPPLLCLSFLGKYLVGHFMSFIFT